ncbi:hypothetical protein Tco_1541076 [Tanacetum coccineum]
MKKRQGYPKNPLWVSTYPSPQQGGQSLSTAAPSSSKTATSAEYTAWTTTDTRIKPVGGRASSWRQTLSPEPAWSIPLSDLTVPTNNWASALKSTYTPPPANSLLAQIGDMATFMDWYCKKQGISELTPKDLEGPTYEIVKVFHPDVVHLQFQMEECHKLLTDQVDDAILRYNVSKPLPLGGDPGYVTIQPDFFFNKDLEYLWYGRKMGRPALSISNMKATCYPDVSLKQMVPHKMWIEEECKHDIAAMYGISHWWFQRQRFYIDRQSLWKQDYPSRADLKQNVSRKGSSNNVSYVTVEDMYLLNLQGHLNHLSPEDKKILTTAVNLWTRNLVIRQRIEDLQLGIESYQTQLNLTKPRWDAKGFEYKHDFIVIDSPRAVTFRDKYGVQMIMRFNEIHKFSDVRTEMELVPEHTNKDSSNEISRKQGYYICCQNRHGLIADMEGQESWTTLIICGDMIQRKLGSFVSFREMITSQLQGKLRLYDEVRARTLFVLSSSNRGRLLGFLI